MITQPPTQHLRLEHGAIAYDVQGEGPLLLLVPGMGELRSTYRLIVPALLEAGFTVVTTDLRGHGDSDATFDSYGDVDTAGDITALLEHLGSPAVIVGNSMAAGSAVLVAAEHPHLVAGLVLMGPVVRNPPVSWVMQFAFRVLTARPWAATVWKAYMPFLYAGAKPVDFADYRAAVIASMRKPGFQRAFSATTRTDHSDAHASLSRVTAPSLVIMGDQDPDFSNPRAEADWVSETLGAEVVMAADSGHYPQSQQPELTASAIIDFVRRTRA